MILHNAGDCEDYAIAKYFTLLKMGVAKESLSLTYVIQNDSNQSHMVLVYQESDKQKEPLILDNLKNGILPASARYDLHPVYSFKTGRKLETALSDLIDL